MNISPDITIERDGISLDLEYIGEGWNGDYQEDDPNDEPLMRFSVYMQDENGDEQQIDDASYCTRIPATTNPLLLQCIAEYLFGLYYSKLLGHSLYDHPSVKQMGEQLSWITPEDYLLEETNA